MNQIQEEFGVAVQTAYLTG